MATPIYRWLYEWFPPLTGLRAAGRFRGVVLLAIAGLAGFGMSCVIRRLKAAGWNQPAIISLAIGLVALANIEVLRAPIGWTPFKGVPAAYQDVARLADAVILEVPFYRPFLAFLNATYLLHATVHWKPMVNGYSGFTTRSYRRLWRAGMNRFPEAPSTDALRKVGVTHVIVHPQRLGRRAPWVLSLMQQSGEFERVGGDESVQIYRLLPR
jgi:hypothetical protein